MVRVGLGWMWAGKGCWFGLCWIRVIFLGGFVLKGLDL